MVGRGFGAFGAAGQARAAPHALSARHRGARNRVGRRPPVPAELVHSGRGLPADLADRQRRQRRRRRADRRDRRPARRRPCRYPAGRRRVRVLRNVNGQSSATPSRVRTRKSDGVQRCQCAAYRIVLPPTALYISGLTSAVGVSRDSRSPGRARWGSGATLLRHQLPFRLVAVEFAVVDLRPLLQTDHLDAGGGQTTRRDCPRGAGADDNDVHFGSRSERRTDGFVGSK